MFRLPILKRTIPALHNHATKIQLSKFWSLQQIIQAATPRGFGKFYPNNDRDKDKDSSNNKNSNQESSDPKKNPFSFADDFKGFRGGGGGGGSSGGNGSNRNQVAAVVASITLSLILSVLYEMSKNGREISWQEFQSHLLESGQVDRLIVTNKNIAKVVVRKPLQTPASSSGFDSGTGRPGEEHIAALDNRGRRVDGQLEFGYAADSVVKGDSSLRNNRYPSLGLAPGSYSPYYFAIGSVESFERKLEESQRQLGIQPRDFIPVMYVSETDWLAEFIKFLPTALVIGATLFMVRGVTGGAGGGGPGNIFKIGKSPAKMITKEMVTTRFKDVAGCDEAKREVMEFVEFLKDPKKFTDLGAKIPRGALLCGPPGTGKTLLARATAGEASVPFFSISGSDFLEMFVGVGPARVRDLFKEARENAPCIVFIDEIDAVGRQRGRGGFSGGNDERENTLNQLLVEMDGFDSNANVVVLAGTNRMDILDAALTRPGRFDRKIMVDKPDIAGRKSIFDVHLKSLTLDGDMSEYAQRLAALTPGFTGADIANICNEAAITAARRSKKKVDLSDFESATDRVIGGLESKKLMSPEEKRIVAHHEAGHAVAGWNLEYADPLLKVTIVPRSSGALGFAQYLPKEIFLRTKDQILDMVCMALAGRAAEQIIFGRVTTGASDDLRRVTQIVYQMVQVYGMNDKLGQLAFPKEDNGGFPADKLYSEATAEVMDAEVRIVVEQAYKRTLELIESKKDQVIKIAECLIEKETITNADVTRLIGPRPFAAHKEYEDFLSAGGQNWTGGKKEATIPEVTVDEGSKEPGDGTVLSPA